MTITAPHADQQLRDRIECAIGLTQDCGGTAGVHAVRDAVLAEVQPELDQRDARIETLTAVARSNAKAHRIAVEECDRLRAELAAERRRRETATARLLHFAAEAHRRKWSYDQGGEGPTHPAFSALHQIGDDMRAAVDALRAADPTSEDPR